MRAHLEGLFPKVCNNCKRRFATLRDYLLTTKHAGRPIQFDAEMGDWRPLQPIGTITFANCPCGSTLALTSAGMPLVRLWSLLKWAKGETRKRRMTPVELLTYLRDEICKQVLNPPSQEDPSEKK